MSLEIESRSDASEIQPEARVEITDVKPQNPFRSTFKLDKQPALGLIDKPQIKEPEVTITAGDVIPAIPEILYTIIAMKDIQTTLVGVAAGVCVAVGMYLDSGNFTWEGFAAAVGFSVLGYFAPSKTKAK